MWVGEQGDVDAPTTGVFSPEKNILPLQRASLKDGDLFISQVNPESEIMITSAAADL